MNACVDGKITQLEQKITVSVLSGKHLVATARFYQAQFQLASQVTS